MKKSQLIKTKNQLPNISQLKLITAKLDLINNKIFE
jgi:hypothetical protein